MSLARTVLPSIRCAHCRISVVSRFTSSSVPNAPQGLKACDAFQSRLISTSSSHQFPRLGANRKRAIAANYETLREGINESLDDNKIFEVDSSSTPPQGSTASESKPTQTPDNDPPASSSSAIPWYLQHSAPAASSDNPLTARQQLPELPPHSPPLLHTFLTHVSTDLGLDDLSLLDLRHLNPPSALGSNLIMVIGTARSEKHLHVSADRFCRWLRKEYRMRPYAAGLLGRNELKIKLRRKAKRAKVMAAAGMTEMASADDGIRSGWVCVTVGRIEEAADTPTPVETPTFVGFGEPETGCMIVVQMFVEDKRLETDLEGLWGKISLQHSKKQEWINDAIAEGNADELELDDLIESPIKRLQRRRRAREALEAAKGAETPKAAGERIGDAAIA